MEIHQTGLPRVVFVKVPRQHPPLRPVEYFADPLSVSIAHHLIVRVDMCDVFAVSVNVLVKVLGCV